MGRDQSGEMDGRNDVDLEASRGIYLSYSRPLRARNRSFVRIQLRRESRLHVPIVLLLQVVGEYGPSTDR